MAAKRREVKTAQNSSELNQQTTRGTAATAKRGFKRATPELTELLRLANLEPTPDVQLPMALKIEALLKRDSKEDVQATVLRWLLDATAELPDGVKIEMLRYFQSRSRDTSGASLPYAVMVLLGYYMYLCEVREVFSSLTEGRVPPVVYFGHELEYGPGELHPERVFLRLDADGKLRFRRPIDLLLALDGVELKYLRRCEVCKRFFYACRINQSGCSPSHSAALYKRQQRANKRNKRRRATSARKR